MMATSRFIRAALVLALSIAVVAGCQKQEGPAEQAGKVVDQTVEKVGQQMEKAGPTVQDAAKGNNTK